MRLAVRGSEPFPVAAGGRAALESAHEHRCGCLQEGHAPPRGERHPDHHPPSRAARRADRHGGVLGVGRAAADPGVRQQDGERPRPDRRGRLLLRQHPGARRIARSPSASPAWTASKATSVSTTWANGRRSSTGAPVLKGCPVSFDCRLVTRVAAGTHTIYIGEIVDLALDPGGDAAALCRRRLRARRRAQEGGSGGVRPQ